MKKYTGHIFVVIVVAIVIAFMAVIVQTQQFQRVRKSLGSNLGGGLDRTVTVYDYNGNPIKSWSGTFDVSESENEVFFDLDGKRVIIHGGIVINEEN
jgi:hypothetical protein